MNSCKFCNTSSDDWDFRTIPVDMGEFGDYEFTFAVTRYKGGSVELQFQREDDDPIWADVFRINYCPYCGNKLSEEVEADVS